MSVICSEVVNLQISMGYYNLISEIIQDEIKYIQGYKSIISDYFKKALTLQVNSGSKLAKPPDNFANAKWINSSPILKLTQQIPKIIQIQIENIKNVAELISKSIVSSKNCKLYEFYSKADENSNIEEVLQSINDSVDIEEKNGIDMYLDYLLKVFEEYVKNNIKNESILWAYAKIYSSIIENYVYFFFDFNNQRNGAIFHWIKYFLTHSRRNISWMFFNSIESMMNFITDYYRFYGLNNNQIEEFAKYLIDIFFGLMKNCEHKKLNPNDFSQLQKEILYKNDDSNWTLINNNYFNNVNEDLDIEDIDVEEYRTAAESAFFDIYSIFKYGLNEKYEDYLDRKSVV